MAWTTARAKGGTCPGCLITLRRGVWVAKDYATGQWLHTSCWKRRMERRAKAATESV